jgi:hypothetical protein
MITEAVFATLPLGVVTVLRNPTEPVAAAVAAVAMFHIQLLPERITPLAAGAGTVTLVPHTPDPKIAATVAGTKPVVAAGVGKSVGITAETVQLASDTTVSVVASAYTISMAAKNPGAGAPALLLFTAKTEKVFVVALSPALNTEAVSHAFAPVGEAPIG